MANNYMKKIKTKLDGKETEALQIDRAGTILFMPEKDLDEILYSSYAEKFSTGKITQDCWLSKFISNNLDALQKNIKTDPSTSVSSFREINKIVKDTQDYYNSKKANDEDYSKYLLRRDLFDWQKKVFDDSAKKFTLLAGRRSGKSFLVSRLALEHCLESPPIINGVKKYRTAVIIGLTITRTANIYWDTIKSGLEQAHINVAKVDNSEYQVIFSNGNKLILSGNNSKAEREKLRGYDISFCAIDECQSQQGLLYLLESIINPMLKGTNGDLVLLGTAPLMAGTEWERSILSDKFTHFHATMEDNPTIPNHEQALQQVLKENNWTRDNITFRREYLGEIAYDSNRLIYGKRKYYTEIPKDFIPTYCYIGVDYGWADYTSFAPIIIDKQGNAYLIKEFKENHIPSSVIVKKMQTLVKEIHKEYSIPVDSIYIVQDSSHQMIGQDFANEGNLNIRNAYKLEQNSQIARVAEALEMGDLLIKENEPFDLECNQFVWQFDEDRKCIIYKIDDNEFHGDIVDSVQYAWSTYIADYNTGALL